MFGRLLALAQFLGIVAMCFSHWGIALAGFAIFILVNFLRIDPGAKTIFGGAIMGVIAVWGYWMLPYAQPVVQGFDIIYGTALIVKFIAALNSIE
jgi:hypothetical protein